MKSINDIDFSGCVLPEWRGLKLTCYRAARVEVTYLKEVYHSGGLGESKAGRRDATGSWELHSVSPASFVELDDLKSICAQVDKFIETELARLNAPEWVEVKWTEVERLLRYGARIQWTRPGVDGWREADSMRGFDASKYQVDLHTVTSGVALYEPDWVAISSSDFERLRGSGATIERVTELCGTVECKADRKTFPPGLELTKAETVKLPTVNAPEGYHWEASAADEENFLAWLVRDSSSLDRYALVAKRTERDINAALVAAFDELNAAEEPKSEPVARKTVEMSADEFLRMLVNVPGPARWASYRNSEGKFYVFRCGSGFFKAATADGCGETRVDMCHFFEVGPYQVEVDRPKEETAWLPCTREEAEANPKDSETRYGIKSQWFTCDDSLVMKYRLNYYEPGTVKREAPEYRTRAKLDRWVKVPWGDVENLQRAGAKVQGKTNGVPGGFCNRLPCAYECIDRTGYTVYQVDRSTLPACYVLGVGFVEQS